MVGAEPVIEKHRWLSPVWLLPFIALLLAGGFLYQQWTSSGQLIRINFAQGNGIGGITEATNMVTSYFDPGTKLIYAIGAVIGLIGGVKVYSKFVRREVA